MQPENRIAEVLKNKTLFITGGTGFIGKVFIEKVLRTCPLVKKIYVLVRAKKENNSQLRIREMFKSPLFDLLKKTRGEEILEKVVAIPGDVSHKNLGLTDVYYKLVTENTEMIYHMAASTRFDDSLKRAIITNTVPIREVVKLAKQCNKLAVLVYVSTAYCFPQQQTLHERVYSIPVNPDDVIKLVETMEEDVVETTGKEYMKDYPNTYTFSKALSEMIISREMDNLPLIITRPSIVIPVFRDPLPGWTDNLYGPAGLLVAAGKGILRSMYCKSSGYADFLPVDIVANALLFVTYDYIKNKSRRVYNLSSSSEIKITWGEIIELTKRITTTKIPFNWIVWYPGGSLKSSKFISNICVILFHYIPAIILDFMIILTGNKPVLWKVQQKITKSFQLFEYYTNNQWDFNNDNVLEARNLLNETEKKVYKSDSEGLDLENYIYDAIHGLRLYVLKEGDETLPTARRHMKIMWALDRLVRTLIWIGIGYLLFGIFSKFM